MLALALLVGCDRCEPPVLVAPSGAHTDVDVVWEAPLADFGLADADEDLTITVSAGDGWSAGVSDGQVYVIPPPGFAGRAAVTVTATAECGEDAVTFDLGVGALSADCDTTFRYPAADGVDAVGVAGPFNDWTPAPMALEDGEWVLRLPLAEGTWPYKLVVNGDDWTCDPAEPRLQCDPGYDAAQWNVCAPGAASCNSLREVASCGAPTLSLTALDVDDAAGTVDLTLEWGGSEPISAITLTVDGDESGLLDGWTGDAPRSVSLTGLTPGRHTVRVAATDPFGVPAEPLYVPLWTDGRDWTQGTLYYAFVDRFDNGDPGNDGLEGTSQASTDYVGGDWQGVIDRLDDLDDLGVTAIWLTAPLDNPSGPWGAKCGATFSGYHGYWPSDAVGLEEHFGDDDLLHALVREAHARDMRVLVDWVGNHVHEDHAYAVDHPDWFNDRALCVDGNNWDSKPETCWFDPFLPDLDYTQIAPLQQQIDDAIDLAIRYDLDGYRVDAVKHMPRHVYADLQARIDDDIEHRDSGGTFDFYTVGETFDGDRGRIASYTGDALLDGQFDFPLYFTLRAAFIDHSASLVDLQASYQSSANAFSGRTMSTFLGNHDVPRFITVAHEGDHGVCADADHLNPPAGPPEQDLPHQKLRLAWTWLLTHPGVPLVYYGDEIGLPGHNDPDNRQPMRFDGTLSAREAATRAHVRALARARRDHPALSGGDERGWWEEADVFAWSRVSGGDAMIAVVNRSGTDRTLENGLSWAGLPAGGVWRDVLTGQTISPSGDRLTIVVPAHGSGVWVRD